MISFFSKKIFREWSIIFKQMLYISIIIKLSKYQILQPMLKNSTLFNLISLTGATVNRFMPPVEFFSGA